MAACRPGRIPRRLGRARHHAPEDDYATYERFVLSTVPIDVPDGDPEFLPAPAVPWLDWAHKTLRLPEDADVDGPRWLDVADELADAVVPAIVTSIAPAAGRSREFPSRTLPLAPR